MVDLYNFMFVEDDNLALNKSAWQISTVHGGNASKAVDGNPDTIYDHGFCSHTNEGHDKPWLTVDLEQRYLIQKVNITNRADNSGTCV